MGNELKAFLVSCEYDDKGTIVFAKTNAQARRIGSDHEWDGWSCRREPWADKYCPGPIPAQEAVDHGWWMECFGCGVRIVEDGYDDDGNEIEFTEVVGTLEGRAFCCPQCKSDYEALEARKKQLGDSTVGIIKDWTTQKLGCVDFTGRDRFYIEDAFGHLQIGHVEVPFNFPGQTYGPAAVRLDAGAGRNTAWPASAQAQPGPPAIGVHVCNGDKEAFQSWVASIKGEGV